MKLLIATHNPGKLKEIKQILKNVSYQIIDLNQTDISPNFDIPETGKTFKANAILKAKGFGKKSNILTVADDSGLAIDALNGQPGVHSARFAENNFNTAFKKIFDLLKDIPFNKRTAKFVCIVALYDPNKKDIITFIGETHGWITTSPKGKNNFGYDPIFLSKDLNKTFGQASFKEKNQVSARARAFEKLKQYLSQTKIKQK